MKYDSLVNIGTWVLVPLQPDIKMIGNSLVYKIKRKPHITIERNKSRVVSQGFHRIK